VSAALKTLPAAVVAAGAVLVAQGQDVLPTWALLVVAAIVAGVGVYVTPPKRGHRTEARPVPRPPEGPTHGLGSRHRG
jgi:hypothetical protein